MSKLYYISENYKPKGAIEGYPLKVVDRMIHEQVKQGNDPDVEVFEKMASAAKSDGGFDWALTGKDYVWTQIYNHKYFDLLDRYSHYHITPEEYDEVMKDSIKDEFDKIPDEAKERVEQAAYDYINPDHYKSEPKEVWEMMLDIWGTEKFIAHCEMCAFKYRMRLGKKPDQPIERDLEKAKWYEDKAKELKAKS